MSRERAHIRTNGQTQTTYMYIATYVLAVNKQWKKNRCNFLIPPHLFVFSRRKLKLKYILLLFQQRTICDSSGSHPPLVHGWGFSSAHLPFGIFPSFRPLSHDWYTKDRGMYYPVYEKAHIKYALLSIEKSNSRRGGSGFPITLSMWFFAICLIPI